MRTHFAYILVVLIFQLVLGSCATSPLGRNQLMLVPDSQLDQMGAQAFQELKKGTPVEADPKTNQYIKCIVGPLLTQAQSEIGQWEVVVFKNSEANAFALPGGKIGVHTGILSVAKTDGQLAAVLGHEIGHVMAKHGAERVSQQAGTQVGLAALGAITPENKNKNTLMGLLGVGVQVGVLLPFSRTQESEADIIGLGLMAGAGFNPEESVALWHNMESASGGKAPPEWLSTHPAGGTRISNLESHMTEAKTKYDQARAAGRSPHCVR